MPVFASVRHPLRERAACDAIHYLEPHQLLARQRGHPRGTPCRIETLHMTTSCDVFVPRALLLLRWL